MACVINLLDLLQWLSFSYGISLEIFYPLLALTNEWYRYWFYNVDICELGFVYFSFVLYFLLDFFINEPHCLFGISDSLNLAIFS